MKWFAKMKDGGPESRVTGYWLCEIKSLISIVLLKFEDGTRDAYHGHAFHALSWLFSGALDESVWNRTGDERVLYRPSWRPIFTSRERVHKVRSIGTSWVLSIRGPWSARWNELVPVSLDSPIYVQRTLTHGRKEVA